MVELDKLSRSVAEFEEYSELDCMPEVCLIFRIKWVEMFCTFNTRGLWKTLRIESHQLR